MSCAQICNDVTGIIKLYTIDTVDLLVSQYAKGEGSAELSQRDRDLSRGPLNAALTG